MISERLRYDHRSHAGNAGDVWKHFLLAEAADHLLSRRKTLLYAESHAGYPEYTLTSPGEWEGGIGRCWPLLSALKNFCYFRIIGEMNSCSLVNPNDVMRYPGSTSLVLEIAKRRCVDVDVDVWDINPCVASAWRDDIRVNFHSGDGFAGVRYLLDHVSSGLILIDPPYLNKGDVEQARDLLNDAEKSGWIVLWWQMMDAETLPEGSFRSYPLRFSNIGLDGSSWLGAVVAIAGADETLAERLDKRVQEFLSASCFAGFAEQF